MAKGKSSKTVHYPTSSFHYYRLLLSPRPPSPSTSSHPIFLRSPRRMEQQTTATLCPRPALSFLLFFLLALALLISTFPNPFVKVDADADEPPLLAESAMVPLPVHPTAGNISEEEREFWQQPDGRGYRPCIKFSLKYRKASRKIVAERRRFVVVLASGGLNQQRNEIVDAVVVARILGAALVVPVLRVNAVWEDDSEFTDIFDGNHFRRTLRPDLRIVSSLPPSHQNIRSSPTGGQIPFNASPFWIRKMLLPELRRDGLLVLKGLNSKLTNSLPSDLQKLRCKVAYHALRFAPPIHELASKLALRMWAGGPYVAVHLRLERDVWVRTGCHTGLGPEYDDAIAKAEHSKPELHPGRLHMSRKRRKLASLCPLNAQEVATLLAVLGAPRSTRLYLAGGEPFGGEEALTPMKAAFPNVATKGSLATGEELGKLGNRSSAMAAIDFAVSLSAEVLVPSHGGNMGRALQGYRTYAGPHRKTVRPNKRAVAQLLEDGSLAGEELGAVVRRLHRASPRGPIGDVVAEPTRECMCQSPRPSHRVAAFFQYHVPVCVVLVVVAVCSLTRR